MTTLARARLESRDAQGRTILWDGARVLAVTIHEAVSRLYRIDLEVVLEPAAKLDERLFPGEPVTLVVELEQGEGAAHTSATRTFHGILGPLRTSLTPPPGVSPPKVASTRFCTLSIVSRFEQMALVSTSAVYVDRSLPEIIDHKLGGYHFHTAQDPDAADYVLVLDQRLERRPVTLQFGEADLSFLGRHAEDLGVAFFFEHGAHRERLVITDVPERFQTLEALPEVRYVGDGVAAGVFALDEHRALVPQLHYIDGYDESRPTARVTGAHRLEGGGALGGVTEYHAAVRSAEEAARLARLRADMHASRRVRYTGQSSYLPLAAASRTRLVEHPSFTEPGGKPLLVLEVTHHLRLPAPWQADAVPSYHNEFVAVPGDVAFRPEPSTTRAKIGGVVTATVLERTGVGARDGALDEDGCYRVDFHFAPRGACTADDLARFGEGPRLRMAQPLAGATEGVHLPLRAGTEVLVAFLHGDPDRPVIVGAVPNATHRSVLDAREPGLFRLQSAHGVVVEFGKR